MQTAFRTASGSAAADDATFQIPVSAALHCLDSIRVPVLRVAVEPYPHADASEKITTSASSSFASVVDMAMGLFLHTTSSHDSSSSRAVPPMRGAVESQPTCGSNLLAVEAQRVKREVRFDVKYPGGEE